MLVSVIGSLLLGLGLCVVMVWTNLALGTIIDIAGIILLLSLIPLIKGLK